VRIDRGGGRGYIGTGGGGQPSRLDDIDPASIERIEVLKGAAAATLYGTEASGGVIQIFTKRGSAGETRWSAEVEQSMMRYPEGRFEPNAGFVTTQAEADRLGSFFGTTVRPYEPFSRNFITPFFETGRSGSYALSVTGGSQLVTYFASGRYSTEDGPISGEVVDALATDVARRGQANVSISIFPVERLTLRVTSMYTESENNTITNNNSIYAPITAAIFGQPQHASCTTPGGSSDPIPGTGRCSGIGNPFGQRAFGTIREHFQRSIEQNAQRYNTSVNANFRPMEGVGLDATFGVDVTNQRDVLYYPFGYNLDRFTTNNVAGNKDLSNRNFRQISSDTKMSWETNLSDRVNSQFVAGAQGFIERTESSLSSGRNFPGPGFAVTEAGSVQNVSELFSSIVNAGFYAQEQIGLDDWIFLTAGARYDYNSAFGESAGGALYPKVSISVVPSDRPGWTSELLSSFRVRAAIGQSGLQPGAFDKLTTFSSIRAEQGAGVRPLNLGNPDLKPEVSTEWEVGTELGLVNNRIALEGSYWNRTVDDALISRQFPVSGGFLQRQLDNIGRLSGQGVELGIRGLAVQTSGVSVNLFANAAYLHERIETLGGAPALKLGESYTRYRNWLREGYAPGAFFGPRVRDDTPYPIDLNGNCQPHTREELLAYFANPIPNVTTTAPFRVLVQNGDPRPCGGGLDFLGLYVGKPVPDWSGSFGGNVSIGQNWQLNTMFEYKAGNYTIHNLTYGFRAAHPSLGGNLPGSVRVRAIMADPSATAEQRLEAAREWVTEYVRLSPYDGLNEMESGDHVRWRELALTYNVPDSFAGRVGARTMAINLTGRNLLLWTKYSGPDPEANLLGRLTGGGLDDIALGVDAFAMPLPRRLTAAIRVGF
jgi:TonB-dependent starch-binding outer membrane protein SusC